MTRSGYPWLCHTAGEVAWNRLVHDLAGRTNRSNTLKLTWMHLRLLVWLRRHAECHGSD
ncbi:hypothetical protein FBU59_001861 [Linderina macrospora]|uniref:Uncharacterized protein n=1 Tax=Linderina macrospora TaxID=4868 RepID=A0ACC1JCZ4_9FUNG|nr:hypothetical protein FBU59_001861 [Linderina macrospora]